MSATVTRAQRDKLLELISWHIYRATDGRPESGPFLELLDRLQTLIRVRRQLLPDSKERQDAYAVDTAALSDLRAFLLAEIDGEVAEGGRRLAAGPGGFYGSADEWPEEAEWIRAQIDERLDERAILAAIGEACHQQEESVSTDIADAQAGPGGPIDARKKADERRSGDGDLRSTRLRGRASNSLAAALADRIPRTGSDRIR
jgi:hypothetical protein